MGRLFGTDGIRGIVGRDITCDQANLVGRALIHALPHKSEGGARVIIGMDTRISSDMLADSLAEVRYADEDEFWFATSVAPFPVFIN